MAGRFLMLPPPYVSRPMGLSDSTLAACDILVVLQVILQQGEDRIESAKAGAVAALGGVVGSIPFAFTADGFSSKLWLALGSALLSSALFGIVMRFVTALRSSNV